MISFQRKVLIASLGAAVMVAAIASRAAADTYQYDAYGRLAAITYSDGSTVTYVYDAAGNRISATKTP